MLLKFNGPYNNSQLSAWVPCVDSKLTSKDSLCLLLHVIMLFYRVFSQKKCPSTVLKKERKCKTSHLKATKMTSQLF